MMGHSERTETNQNWHHAAPLAARGRACDQQVLTPLSWPFHAVYLIVRVPVVRADRDAACDLADAGCELVLRRQAPGEETHFGDPFVCVAFVHVAVAVAVPALPWPG